MASVEDNEHLNDHMDALLCSMALLCVEVGHDEVFLIFLLLELVELLRFKEKIKTTQSEQSDLKFLYILKYGNKEV